MQRSIALPGNSHLPKGLLNKTSGLLVSGEVGTGKTSLVREISRWAAQQDDVTLIVLDPDNDYWEDCQRDLSDMPARVRNNSYSFFPADTTWPIGSFNPLAVERELCRSNIEYEARLECRVMHASHLQLAAVNQENFDGAPRLFKWLTTINRSLAKLGMTIPDGREFFDVGSDLYRLLTAAIPDGMA